MVTAARFKDAASAMPLLRAENLVRRYGTQAIVDGVSLDVRSGEVVAIVGPNGAGKSTLFRLLLRLERADAGRVLLEGRELHYGDTFARQRLAGVFQTAVLFSGTVSDNIAFGLTGTSRATRQAAVDQALDWFGLTHRASANVRTLSGGEAQRVALARALVLEPDVLLLDEPSAGLDATVRSRFLRELERVARTHARAIILITHDPRDVFGLADRIAVMDHGRIVQVGTPDEVMLRPATVFAAELSGAELLLNGVVTAVDDTLATVALPGDATLLATIGSGEVLGVGAAAQVAYRPEDVVIAQVSGAPSSAANRLRVVVTALAPAGAHVRAQLRTEDGACVLSALLTRGSVTELGIDVGKHVQAQLKASALHVWRRGARHQQSQRRSDV